MTSIGGRVLESPDAAACPPRRAPPRPLPARAGAARRAERDAPAEQVAATLAAAQIRLVMTAHPTEARRRTTIEKLARVYRALRELDGAPGLRQESAALRRI